MSESSTLLPNNDNEHRKRGDYASERRLFESLRDFISMRGDGFLPTSSNPWFPVKEDGLRGRPFLQFRRQIFLILTEPSSSTVSLIFFWILIFAITSLNVLYIMQTMEAWQYTPKDCVSCGGTHSYMFEDDDFIQTAIESDVESLKDGVPCVCPPAPLPFTILYQRRIMYFLTAEWIARVLLFTPSHPSSTFWGRQRQLVPFLLDFSTILDALSILPFYLESANVNGLASLRLIRIFRIFTLVRLGQYNKTFQSLVNVLQQSLVYLQVLILVLLFGAAIFGSMLYWVEKGTWKYYEPAGDYRFVRLATDGITEEPSPFTSIPAAFWWFVVTATTVGYGDYYPTSTAGKWCASFAMLMGVLVIAFPVSVFSDLWSTELRKAHGWGDDQPSDHDSTSQDGQEEREYVQMERKDLQVLLQLRARMEDCEHKTAAILKKYNLDSSSPP